MFSETSLRELNTMALQKHFSTMKVSHATASKIKNVLASVLGSAVQFGLLVKNPLVSVEIPAPRVGKRTKPHITPEQFNALLNFLSEPYATMVYVCVMAGLRVSELVGLKWEDVHADSLTIDERYCRGEWGCPKTTASSATIGVDERVIQRIHRLKDTEVTINWVGELAGVAAFLCHVDGGSGRRSKGGAGTDAAFANHDNHGHLCAIRSRIAEASGGKDDGHGRQPACQNWQDRELGSQLKR